MTLHAKRQPVIYSGDAGRALLAWFCAGCAGVLLLDCGLCSRFSGEVRLSRAPVAIAFSISVLLAMLLTQAAARRDGALQGVASSHLSALITLVLVFAFPPLVTLAAAHRAIPCPVCLAFWISLLLLAIVHPSLGSNRKLLVGSTLLVGFLGAKAVQGGEFAARLRREALIGVDERWGFFAAPMEQLPEIGAKIDGLATSYDGPWIVATNCSTCLKQGLARILKEKGFDLKAMNILAPNLEVAASYRELFDSTRIRIERDEWRRFGLDASGPPAYFELGKGKVLKRIP